MMRGMYSAISGMSANQTMMDSVANDLANVNTVGYKATQTTFADELSQLQRGANAPGTNQGGSNALQIGLGVQVTSNNNLMSQGALQNTGNPLDVAIQGDGFFRVGAGTPTAGAPTTNLPTTMQYTRSGNLATDSLGYVVTQGGLYVVGKNAVATVTATGTTYNPGPTDSYLQIPPQGSDVAVGQDGSVSYVDGNPVSPTYQQRVVAGYISLAAFPNEGGLERLGSGLWGQSANSGSPAIGTPGTTQFGQTISGTLEMSNVDMATEMTTMISAERGFQVNSSVISTSDQLLQTLVNLKQG
jgi:flagellar hook protein FlgE